MLTWSFPRGVRCHAQPSAERSPLNTTVPALKEWAATIEALGKGMQTVIFRKGGIREPLFTPRAASFMLFPTAFHADKALLKADAAAQLHGAMAVDPRHDSTLQLNYAAHVTGAWSTSDPALLHHLHDLHMYTDAFIDQRLRWRPSQKLTVLELRVWRMDPPVCLPNEEHLWGCFSWIDIPAANGWDTCGALALEDSEFGVQQATLRAALQHVEVEAIECLSEK